MSNDTSAVKIPFPDRRVLMPNGRRESDMFLRDWCEQKHEFIEEKFKAYERWVTRVEDKQFWILLTQIGNLIGLAVVLLKLVIG